MIKLRILHCPTVVGGNPGALSRLERAVGAQSHSVTIMPNPYGYPVDEDLYAGRGWLRRELARWGMIRRALREYDVIHYNFGRSLGPLRSRVGGKGWLAPIAALRNLLYAGPLELCDLRWARQRGKVIAVTYQGGDARQGDVARRLPIHFAHEVGPDYYTAETDAQIRHRIRVFAASADLIYALNPDLLAVLPSRAKFLPYCSVDVAEFTPMLKRADRACLRVVHAPSHRKVKGTHYVIAAVECLRAEGLPIELVLVENMIHAEARRIYATADLAVDQLLAGFYGALAVELMALAVPVVCYLREADLKALPAGMRESLPLINAEPATLIAVLREWLGRRRGELRDRGARSREFVRRWHDPQEVARGVLADYEEKWMDIKEGRRVNPSILHQGE